MAFSFNVSFLASLESLVAPAQAGAQFTVLNDRIPPFAGMTWRDAAAQQTAASLARAEGRGCWTIAPVAHVAHFLRTTRQ